MNTSPNSVTEAVDASKDAVATADKAEEAVTKAEDTVFTAETGAAVLNAVGNAYQSFDRRRAGSIMDRFVGGVKNLFGGLKEIATSADSSPVKNLKDRILP